LIGAVRWSAPFVDNVLGGWLTELETRMMTLKLTAGSRWWWHTVALACAPGS
jgi:hypothetical protein